MFFLRILYLEREVLFRFLGLDAVGDDVEAVETGVGVGGHQRGEAQVGDGLLAHVEGAVDRAEHGRVVVHVRQLDRDRDRLQI